MDAIAGGCLLEQMHRRLRQIKNSTSRGFSHSGCWERPDLTRHQTRRCLQVNWKKKGTEGDCAMLCVPGNKEIRSTQRTLREAKPM